MKRKKKKDETKKKKKKKSSFFEDVTNRFEASRRGNVPLSSLTPARYTPHSPRFQALFFSAGAVLVCVAPTAPLPPDGFVHVRGEGRLCGVFCAVSAFLTPAAGRWLGRSIRV